MADQHFQSEYSVLNVILKILRHLVLTQPSLLSLLNHAVLAALTTEQRQPTPKAARTDDGHPALATARDIDPPV